MPFLTFLFEAVFISLSGVMAPGPITTVTVAKGSDSPHAGAMVAIGHGMVEFPLMISIFYGIGYFFNLPQVKAAIAFLGGLFLLSMGLNMIRSIKQTEVTLTNQARSPILAGLLLSLGNPYFLVWWVTVGAALVLRSATFGMWAFVVFAFLHWLCDFFWCYFLSALSFKGGHFFGRGFQKIVFLISGVLLLFFSGKFIVDAVRIFLT